MTRPKSRTMSLTKCDPHRSSITLSELFRSMQEMSGHPPFLKSWYLQCGLAKAVGERTCVRMDARWNERNKLSSKSMIGKRKPQASEEGACGSESFGMTRGLEILARKNKKVCLFPLCATHEIVGTMPDDQVEKKSKQGTKRLNPDRRTSCVRRKPMLAGAMCVGTPGILRNHGHAHAHIRPRFPFAVSNPRPGAPRIYGMTAAF